MYRMLQFKEYEIIEGRCTYQSIKIVYKHSLRNYYFKSD